MQQTPMSRMMKVLNSTSHQKQRPTNCPWLFTKPSVTRISVEQQSNVSSPEHDMSKMAAVFELGSGRPVCFSQMNLKSNAVPNTCSNSYFFCCFLFSVFSSGLALLARLAQKLLLVIQHQGFQRLTGVAGRTVNYWTQERLRLVRDSAAVAAATWDPAERRAPVIPWHKFQKPIGDAVHT